MPVLRMDISLLFDRAGYLLQNYLNYLFPMLSGKGSLPRFLPRFLSYTSKYSILMHSFLAAATIKVVADYGSTNTIAHYLNTRSSGPFL
jgi:hypothetical protein